jgi:hypothetical protein
VLKDLQRVGTGHLPCVADAPDGFHLSPRPSFLPSRCGDSEQSSPRPLDMWSSLRG